MISIHNLFEKTLEIPDEGLHPYELIQLARKKKLIKKNPNHNNLPKLEEGQYAVKRLDKKSGINPLTGRKKNVKKISYLVTGISPMDRTLKNLPRDSKKKAKVHFKDWLELKIKSHPHATIGQAPDGTWYGWSHRAIYGFRPGDLVKPGSIGNKYRMDSNGNEIEEKKFEPYKIKDDNDAMEHAIRFSREVS